MTFLLTETATSTFPSEPLLAALGIVATTILIFLAIKGKLRDWFLR